MDKPIDEFDVQAIRKARLYSFARNALKNIDVFWLLKGSSDRIRGLESNGTKTYAKEARIIFFQ